MKRRRGLIGLAAALVTLGIAFAWVMKQPATAIGLTDANSRPAPSLNPSSSSKRVLIIGGTSGIGLETVRLALARGHRVTVMSRRGQIDLPPSPMLHVQQGDIRDADAVAQAVRDQDAVVVSISAPPGRKEITVFSEGARNVLAAMSSAQRLLVVSGIGAGDSRGRGGFGYDRILQPLLLAENYKDKDRKEALVRKSAVNWTIVRPGFLNDGASEERYRIVHDLNGVRSGAISRADVAHYLVAGLEQDADVRRTVLLSN